MTYRDRLSREGQAPFIVLGMVVDVRKGDEASRSPGDPRIATEETIISIHVEHVLRGRINRDYLDVVYFAYSRANERDLGRITYTPETGQRRLFFLRTEGETFRTIGDVTDYTLPVRSGPIMSGTCAGKSAGCCIAAILLRPPPDEQVGGFLKDLPDSTYAAALFCSPQAARERLLRLAQHRDERIAAGADEMILMLGQWFP